MTTLDIANEYKAQAIFRLNENTPRIAKCLDQISEEELWQRPNSNLSSMGNLILHLCGNIGQYAIASLGGVGDSRQRDLEFSVTGGFTKAELMEKLSNTLTVAIKTIEATDAESLMKTRSVQGFSLTGIGIITHVVEHYSYHTGQIAFFTKLLRNNDLGFYANLDLNVKNG